MTTPTIDTTGLGAPRVEDLLGTRIGRRPRRRFLRFLVLFVFPLVALAALLAYGTGYHYAEIAPARVVLEQELPEHDGDLKRFVAKQQKAGTQMGAELDKLAPHEIYVVVDRRQNRLYLMKDGQVQVKAVISAGSGMVLKENPDWAAKHNRKPREWTFDTPPGLFHIQRRVENPIWTKPAWEFVQSALIPTKPEDYYEEGTLGKYAMHLGDGYMIHGTLYTRLLGRAVTHGCIRVGADDLQKVWDSTKIGTPVFIF